MVLNKEWETEAKMHAELPKVTLQDNGNITSCLFLPSGRMLLSS